MYYRRPRPSAKEIYTDAAKTSSHELVCVPPRATAICLPVR